MDFIILLVVIFILIKTDAIRKLMSLYKKSDAAASVQALLEQQVRLGSFRGDPVGSQPLNMCKQHGRASLECLMAILGKDHINYL